MSHPAQTHYAPKRFYGVLLGDKTLCELDQHSKLTTQNTKTELITVARAALNNLRRFNPMMRYELVVIEVIE